MMRTYALRQSQPHYLADLDTSLLWRLAAPQLILAILAVTSYHVQVITRLSSGYPLWYIWLAALVCTRGRNTTLKGVFRWMVLYALIQAGLYSSFLPPA
jgi:phosphatidylinositol glycan class V